MGERVEWQDRETYSTAWEDSNVDGWRSRAYPSGEWWVVFRDGSDMEGRVTDLASAKAAAEAALRERGLVGGEAMTSDVPVVPTPTGEALDRAAFACLGAKRADGETDNAFAARAVKEWSSITLDGVRVVDLWATSPPEPPRTAGKFVVPDGDSVAWFSDCVGLTQAGCDAMRAAAMATPQGRRALAAQAVEEAVADGARRGLDAEALRVALVCAVEQGASCHEAPDYARAIALHANGADNVAAWEGLDLGQCAVAIDAFAAYDRALAARSARPLGRPPLRRGARGREW